MEAKKRPHRRCKTDFRVVVVPAHKCQLLDDPLANACMYGGLEEAHRPECKGAPQLPPPSTPRVAAGTFAGLSAVDTFGGGRSLFQHCHRPVKT